VSCQHTREIFTSIFRTARQFYLFQNRPKASTIAFVTRERSYTRKKKGKPINTRTCKTGHNSQRTRWQRLVKTPSLNLAVVSAVSCLNAVVLFTTVAQPVLAQTSTGNTVNTDATKLTESVSKLKSEKTMKNPNTDKDAPDTSDEEAVTTASYDGSQFTFSVTSHGCTTPEHFTIKHTVVRNQCQLTIVRTQPDLCRRMPMLVEISIPWIRPDECSALPLVITNPLLEQLTGGNMKLPSLKGRKKTTD